MLKRALKLIDVDCVGFGSLSIVVRRRRLLNLVLVSLSHELGISLTFLMTTSASHVMLRIFIFVRFKDIWVRLVLTLNINGRIYNCMELMMVFELTIAALFAHLLL